MTDYLAMSDEDFSKESPPVVEAADRAAALAGVVATPAAEPVVETPVVEAVVEPVVAPAEPAVEPVVDVDKGTVTDPVVEPVVPAKEPQTPAPVTGGDLATPPAKVEGEPVVEEPDYKAVYDQLMAPLKANGKTIDIRDPKELIQLAQQGANYTQKMQELAPKRKFLQMLENNGLLDEGKLSFLIDLENKDPNAIKKLIKDSAIDPLDLDVSGDVDYQAGQHQVSDAEVNFHGAIADLSSSESGRSTLQAISSTWDQASKNALMDYPEMFATFHEQQQSGVYALITAEMDRMRTLGQIGPNVPFVQAYKQVGDQMVADKKFDQLVVKKEPVVQTPVAVRAATPKPAVDKNDRAAAASVTQAVTKKADVLINPLAMRDEDFLKYAESICK